MEEEDFKPVLSHIDQQNDQDGWMFDTVMFANGGNPFEAYSTKDLWSELLDRLFHEGTNIDALDAVTATAKQKLRDSSRKTKVVISIPYPALEFTDWGTLEGKKISFSPDQVGGHEAAFKDCIGHMKRWASEHSTKKL